MLTVVPAGVQELDITDDSFVHAYFNVASETLPFIFVFQYARECKDHRDALHVVLGMQLYGNDFYMLNCGTIHSTALGAWGSSMATLGRMWGGVVSLL